ncbi:Na(+)-translocating NADH-quinone reductase subunit A [Parvicella tangerina]|uniref:Na(+)-translocating NADH-quinone reductase subunit A n=1 Tax=Parvicella tangerina TaxID=2829795 RepID=A0A916JP64_9FLAO|nr:Na(+)-translocating NADH-quinone reductase subunit A [Parvicella tangerina]CAG5084083.1 Na(+)-translocating NADH-quinone reductase subunit A [Parvicella tangerina]
MSKSIKIRKGLDINLIGEADKVIVDTPRAKTYALKPVDFHGVVPKMALKVGEKVKAGGVVFKNKYNMDVNFVSPVSGTIKDIVRGAKRRILSVVIDADDVDEYETINVPSMDSMDAEAAKQFLLTAGLWPFIKMRPLDVIAKPSDSPIAIYISGFDSAPLAADYDFTLHGKEKEFQAGVDILKKLTSGPVHLTLRNGMADNAMKGVRGCEINSISGPHPAGNVGVQIHHIKPLNKGEVVWTVNAQDVALIGSTALNGKFDATRLIALAGEQAKNRKYYRTTIGTEIKTITSGNLEGDNNRIISGNVLTGSQVSEEDHLGYYHSQVTAIKEGDEYKFFLTKGWLGLGFGRFSNSRAYPAWLMPKSKKYSVDTNLNGEERAFVVTGQYDKVFPFDIYPVQLVKAAITSDIDKMEQLGIYEVAPEDFALCEVVCTSKIEVQKHIREALDLVEKECF